MLRAVRDGKHAPLTCPTCDCRLNHFQSDPQTVVAHHFLNDYDNERDASDHLCSDIGKVWTLDIKKVKHLID